MGDRRKKFWSYVAGDRGRNWVRTFEKEKGGLLFIEWYEADGGGAASKRKRASLRHRDRGKAKDAADELAAAFIKGESSYALAQLDPGGTTIHHVIDRYLENETPFKRLGKQGHDRRTGQMFKKFFPRNRKAETLNLGDWNGFIRARREYLIGPAATLKRANSAREDGEPLPNVGDRQIEYDLRFLWAVLNWATKNGDNQGNPLLNRKSLSQFVQARHWPREKNPERPSLSEEQYKKLIEVAPEVDWRFHAALVLVHETGHRIGSVQQLRWSDLEVRETWIRWREETDKVAWEHQTPLTNEAAAALPIAERNRLDRVDGWVFPSPTDPDRPCSRNIMRDWWNSAQDAAGLSHIQRLGWHSLRRKFANDLRQVPLKDLASLGGWKDTQTLLKCYLKEDEQAMVEALQSRRSPHARRLAGKKNGADVGDR